MKYRYISSIVVLRMIALMPVFFALAVFAEPAAKAPEALDPATFAAQIHDAWQKGAPMPQLNAADPAATLADGYAIQKLFVEKLLQGSSPGGYKAAIVSQGGQTAMGITGPLVAVIPASGILRAAGQVVISLANDPARHLETEIGYILGAPITTPLEKLDDLRARVRAIAPMIEVPGGPVEHNQPPSAADLAAWNINAKQIIVGEERDPAGVDPDAIEITMTHDGETVNTARGGDAAGGQWETLLKTVNGAVRLGYPLRPGQIIINGALGKILEATPGTYRADYGTFGVISFRVE